MDFIFGVTIFLLILILSMKFLSENSTGYEENNDDFFEEINKFSQSLMGTGIPVNWTEEHVTSIGLINEDNSINISKIGYFGNLSKEDYTNVRDITNIKSEFLVYFENKTGNLLNFSGFTYIGPSDTTLQNVSDSGYENVASIARYVIYRHDGIAEIISMKVVIWRD